VPLLAARAGCMPNTYVARSSTGGRVLKLNHETADHVVVDDIAEFGGQAEKRAGEVVAERARCVRRGMRSEVCGTYSA
jgi:hypothetical protein